MWPSKYKIKLQLYFQLVNILNTVGEYEVTVVEYNQ